MLGSSFRCASGCFGNRTRHHVTPPHASSAAPIGGDLALRSGIFLSRQMRPQAPRHPRRRKTTRSTKTRLGAGYPPPGLNPLHWCATVHCAAMHDYCLIDRLAHWPSSLDYFRLDALPDGRPDGWIQIFSGYPGLRAEANWAICRGRRPTVRDLARARDARHGIRAANRRHFSNYPDACFLDAACDLSYEISKSLSQSTGPTILVSGADVDGLTPLPRKTRLSWNRSVVVRRI
ncbi:hypothetical protein B0H15DRAFT_483063 [Mycena belliarum]|uniref:Uncharacterized protein n=1 Tax=Mycena belliarum TaxID=1033014 RepID=A0AAD6TWZ7_9AGAR|nr:hypothetical protein B0H15DRAFT_483063 [Mycena belliae]